MGDLEPYKLPPDLYRVYKYFREKVPLEDMGGANKARNYNGISLRTEHDTVHISKIRTGIRVTRNTDSTNAKTRRAMAKEFLDVSRAMAHISKSLGL